MEKVMLPVFKADILQAISKFPKKDLESLLREIEELARTERKVTPKFVEAQELKMLSGMLRSVGGGRAVVEGDIGVGKTTFVNYHRYLWEAEATDRLLTPATEISLASGSGVSDFVGNIVGAVLGKIVGIVEMGE